MMGWGVLEWGVVWCRVGWGVGVGVGGDALFSSTVTAQKRAQHNLVPRPSNLFIIRPNCMHIPAPILKHLRSELPF